MLIILSGCIANAFAYRGLKPMSDAEIRSNILDGSLKSFEGSCPCPFSKDDKGKLCGDDSAYFRSPGKVLCYERDISDSEVRFYRQKYMITDPKADPRGQLNFGIGEQQDNNNANPNYDGSNSNQNPF